MKRVIKTVAIIILSVVLFISGFQIYDIYQDRHVSQVTFDDIADMVSQIEETSDSKKQAAYQAIAKQNSDFIGWITIEGTPINYPIMQTIDRPNFYLTRDFNKNYNKHGVPFVAEQCDVSAPSDNITIYGHHMKDGTMFSALDKYKQQDYYKEHPIVEFDTLTSCNQYQIIAAFKTVAYSEQGFRYYEFHDAENEKEFDDYIKEVKKRAFYDTGYSAQYGDKLITLSTCEYTQKNGRVVVVAKLIQK